MNIIMRYSLLISVIFICHEIQSSLENNVTERPKEVVSRKSSDIHYNMVANTIAMTSVLASSQPIWCHQVASNALRIIASTTLTITDDGDTQAKRWAALKISNKRHVKLALNSNIRERNLHPLIPVRTQCETGCWVRIQKLRNFGVISMYGGGRK